MNILSEELHHYGNTTLVKKIVRRNNKTSEYVYLKKQNAVIVVAQYHNCICFVRQHRIAAGIDSLELPGGRIETNETPERAALRELKEETGLTSPKGIDLLGKFYPLLSVTNEEIYVYLVREPILGTPNCDESEDDLTVTMIPNNEIKQTIREGIVSGPDMLALYMYLSL